MPAIRELTLDLIVRLTGIPELYDRAEFLRPMRKAALSIHKEIGSLSGSCSGCQRSAKEKAEKSLAAAFARLTMRAGTQNKIGELGRTISELLQQPADFWNLRAADEKGQELLITL